MSVNISINELMEIVHCQYLGGNTRRYWDSELSRVHARPYVHDPVALAVVRAAAESYDSSLTYEEQMVETAAALREMAINIEDIAEMMERALEA